MNNATNTISEAFDILNNFESIAFQTVEKIQSELLNSAEKFLHNDANIQLNRENLEQLLIADQHLLKQVQDFGLDNNSPARFALSHTAKRLVAIEDFISPIQTQDIKNAIAV